jgi:hypothetical protein
VGEGRALYHAVVAADLEGIVAKKLADPHNPKLTRWHMILNRDLYEGAPNGSASVEASALVRSSRLPALLSRRPGRHCSGRLRKLR